MLRPPVPPARIAAVPFLALLLALAVLAVPTEAQETPRPPAVPLNQAALQGNVDAIRQHLAAGSDLDQLDAWGSTPSVTTSCSSPTPWRIRVTACSTPARPPSDARYRGAMAW